jgi:midasin (ATPase involved in ribosome maturation)
MLKKIFEQQKKFQKLIHEPTAFITPFERIKACNIQIRRSIDELFESLREMPYDLSGFSKHKKVLSSSENNIIDEMVDAFLFNVNALNILGEDAESFMRRCLTKQGINIDRFNTKQRFRNCHDNFLIVIEGADGVGKSSICEVLSQKLGYPIMKMPETNGDIERFSMFYRQLIAKIDNVMILDRFFPSSLVYGTFFRS